MSTIRAFPKIVKSKNIEHITAFQVGKHLKGKNLGEETERMCALGNIIAQVWIKNAVDEALKHIK